MFLPLILLHRIYHFQGSIIVINIPGRHCYFSQELFELIEVKTLSSLFGPNMKKKSALKIVVLHNEVCRRMISLDHVDAEEQQFRSIHCTEPMVVCF